MLFTLTTYSSLDPFRYHDSEAARAIVGTERHKIELYRKYNTYYDYGVYIEKNKGIAVKINARKQSL